MTPEELVFVPVGQQPDTLAPDSHDRATANDLLTQLAHLEELAAVELAKLKEANDALAPLRAAQADLMQQLSELAGRVGCEIVAPSTGFVVRYVKGRRQVKWDAERLSQILSPNIAKLTLTEVVTWKADTAVLNALADSGKLDSHILQTCREVTPGVNRFQVERIK